MMTGMALNDCKAQSTKVKGLVQGGHVQGGHVQGVQSATFLQ